MFSEKVSAITGMRQKCVKNLGKIGTFQNASKVRGTPLGENTFWTIPIPGDFEGARSSQKYDKQLSGNHFWNCSVSEDSL